MILNKDEHVYCTNCDNFKKAADCSTAKTFNPCKLCICQNCDCTNPEDSTSFEYRPNYKQISE